MSWHVALAILAVLIIVGGFVWWFVVAKRNAEKAAVRRTENEVLKHDAMLREEERQSARAGRVVVQPPGSPIGVAVKRKAKKP